MPQSVSVLKQRKKVLNPVQDPWEPQRNECTEAQTEEVPLLSSCTVCFENIPALLVRSRGGEREERARSRMECCLRVRTHEGLVYCIATFFP